MLTLNLSSSLGKLGQDLDLRQKQHRVAAQRALNVAARGRVTDAVTAIRARYPKIAAKDIRDGFEIRLASQESLVAVVKVRGRPLSLGRFVVGSRNAKRIEGISVAVKGGSKMIPHAFIAKGRDFGGGRSDVVFIRPKYVPRSKAGPSGLVALRTVDIPNALNIKELAAALNAQTGERFSKEFMRQLQVALQRTR